jgi:AcrR family transcriptional regulator
MRKDAARSRRAILDAARELYHDDLEASFADIAYRAGVGQATVYRHFADRRTLLTELAEEELGRLEDRVDKDPIGPGSFETLLNEMVAGRLRSHALVGAIRAGEFEESRVYRITERTLALFAPRLEAAQAAGVVGADLTLEDVITVLAMIDGAFAPLDRDERERAAPRVVKIALYGLRSRDR